MPDITMCKGEGCPMKNDCYRFRAIPDKYMQSHFMEAPFNHDRFDCVRFIGLSGWPVEYLTELGDE